MHHIQFSSPLPLFFRKGAHKPHFNKYGYFQQWYYLSQWVAGGDCITFLFLLEKRNSKYKLLLFYWLFVVLPFIKTQPHVPEVHLVRRSLHIQTTQIFIWVSCSIISLIFSPRFQFATENLTHYGSDFNYSQCPILLLSIIFQWEHGIVYG